MTGKEKKQYILDVVRQKYDELIIGNEITLDSGMFNSDFVSVFEIIFVLGKLEEQKKIKIIRTKFLETREIFELESQYNDIESYRLNPTSDNKAWDKFNSLKLTIKITNLPVATNALNTPNEYEHKVDIENIKNERIKLHILEPEHYNKKTGVLTLSPTDKVMIAKRGNAIRKSNGKKFDQCWVLECVFKSVKTMNDGVHIAKILDVSRAKIGEKEIKKVLNIVQEINEKVTDVNGPEKLIKLQNKHVFVNSSYL